MAASVPASLPSTRESPARVDSEQSGLPLPRGRAVACEMRRDQRSPPPSAHKRRAPSTDAPAGKRAAPANDDEHSISSTLRHPSLSQPDKVRRRLWEPGDSQRAAIVGECRGVDEIGNCGIFGRRRGPYRITQSGRIRKSWNFGRGAVYAQTPSIAIAWRTSARGRSWCPVRRRNQFRATSLWRRHRSHRGGSCRFRSQGGYVARTPSTS